MAKKKKKKTISRKKQSKATGRSKSTKKKVSKKKAKTTTVKKKTAAAQVKKKTTKKKSKRRGITIKEPRRTKPEPKTKKKTTTSGRGKKTATKSKEIVTDAKGYVFINGRRVRMISTKNDGPVRKVKPQPVAPEPVAEEVEVKLTKTKLSKKELNYYRNMLLIKRAEIVGDLSAMEAEALRSSGGDLSHMPIHMADLGTDTYDQDFMLGMAEAERKQLREIDDALQRIEDRTYGVCQQTGESIPKARLDAKPWAKYTVEAARKLEGEWSPS